MKVHWQRAMLVSGLALIGWEWFLFPYRPALHRIKELAAKPRHGCHPKSAGHP